MLATSAFKSRRNPHSSPPPPLPPPLTNLIGHNDELLLEGELDDVLDVLSGEDRAGGVARVNDDQQARHAAGASLVQRPLQLRDVQSPGARLVQIVVDLRARLG